MKARISILVITAGLILGSSGGCRRSETLGPPAVHWGRDTCEGCGMILSDPRYVGAVVLRRQAGGEVESHLFDDLGEMLAWSPPAAVEIRWYAGNHQTGEWIDATAASFVRDADFHTPMSSGFVAFATSASAKAARPRPADQVLDFTAARHLAVADRH